MCFGKLSTGAIAISRLGKIGVADLKYELASRKDAKAQKDKNVHPAYAREGDVVVVHSMDRLARNLDDLRRLIFPTYAILLPCACSSPNAREFSSLYKCLWQQVSEIKEFHTVHSFNFCAIIGIS